MTDKQFSTVWADALTHTTDRDAWVSDWTLSSLFSDPGADAAIDSALVEQLGQVWDVAHMSVKDLRAITGLSQVAFAERFCVPRRTVENWERGTCPDYIRLMLAQLLGVIQR